MKHETAGDSMTGLKWTRRTTAKIAIELQSAGIQVSARPVPDLLKKMGFSLRVNHKKLSGNSQPHRNAQFTRIAKSRDRCAAEELPIISVDTKKKELVGVFKNPGTKWDRGPVLVKDHDFRSEADGIAVPYGVYDTRANHGTLFVGSRTTTATGRSVRARPVQQCFEKGIKITDAQMQALAIRRDEALPKCNYTISPN